MWVVVIGGVGFIGFNFVCYVICGDYVDLVDVEIIVFDFFIYFGNFVNFILVD